MLETPASVASLFKVVFVYQNLNDSQQCDGQLRLDCLSVGSLIPSWRIVLGTRKRHRAFACSLWVCVINPPPGAPLTLACRCAVVPRVAHHVNLQTFLHPPACDSNVVAGAVLAPQLLAQCPSHQVANRLPWSFQGAGRLRTGGRCPQGCVW